MNSSTSIGNDTSSLTRAAENAARDTSRTAQHGIDRVSDTLSEARAQTGDTLRQLAHNTEDLAHRGMDLVRESADQLRERSYHVKDVTTHYIQDEPVKSMLIAAAVGATLMGLFAMLSRNGHHR
ncbi:MAG: hypothetical protein KGZ67_08010 [Hydrogenophaga sp.]|jgi:ElaB/YqjD/DUF883 family membrane-anchored ribosome-binding protein|nr:hypothetical protein [Hydrogenophaga sp.]